MGSHSGEGILVLTTPTGNAQRSHAAPPPGMLALAHLH